MRSKKWFVTFLLTLACMPMALASSTWPLATVQITTSDEKMVAFSLILQDNNPPGITNRTSHTVTLAKDEQYTLSILNSGSRRILACMGMNGKNIANTFRLEGDVAAYATWERHPESCLMLVDNETWENDSSDELKIKSSLFMDALFSSKFFVTANPTATVVLFREKRPGKKGFVPDPVAAEVVSLKFERK